MRTGPLRRWAALAVAPIMLLAGLAAGPGTTAAAEPTIDGQFSGTGPIAAGGTFTLKVTDRGGVPASGVGAVALNVTVTNPTAASFLTVHPTGQPRPNAANLVFGAGQTIPNMVIVQVGTGGQISIFNYGGTTDVVVDVLGWFPAGQLFTAMNPARLLDTRPGFTTVDDKFVGEGAIGAGGVLELKVTNRGGVLPTSGIGAVALSVTAVDPTAASFLTVWPTGEEMPTAANLNFVAGQSVPNMVMAKVGQGGQISIYNYAGSAHVVVDVLGWVPNSGSFTGVRPARLLDTRPGYPTIDGQQAGAGAVGAGGILELPVLDRGGVPATGVGAVALNVAVTNPTASSFLTVYPSGAARPTAANLNWTPNRTVANMVIVKVGSGGTVSLYNLTGTADLVVDVLGWFPEGASYAGLTPARLMDSR